MTTLLTPRLLLRGLLVSLAMAAALFSMTPASGAGAGLWSQTTDPMAKIRYENTMTLLPDGTVLVAGGSSYWSHASVERYTPADGKWATTQGSMTEARSGHTATLLSDGSGMVLVTGGLEKYKGDHEGPLKAFNEIFAGNL